MIAECNWMQALLLSGLGAAERLRLANQWLSKEAVLLQALEKSLDVQVLSNLQRLAPSAACALHAF